MKKLFCFVALMLVGIGQLLAYDFTLGQLGFTITGEGEVCVSAYTGRGGDVSIPQALTYRDGYYIVSGIGDGVFRGCTGLTDLFISGSVKSIGKNAFMGCSGLKSIMIPASVNEIGENAFYGCTGLTSISVKEGNSRYDSRDNCQAIIDNADHAHTLIVGCCNSTVPDGVTRIGDYAFLGCKGLASMVLPSSVTDIGQRAFYGCTELTSVRLSKNQTRIGLQAFQGCRSLASIVIPQGVTDIGSQAFLDCPNLATVVNKAAKPQAMAVSAFSSYGTLHVPQGCKDAYAAQNHWRQFAIVDDLAPETTYSVHVTGSAEGGAVYDGMKYGNGESFTAAYLYADEVVPAEVAGCEVGMSFSDSRIHLDYCPVFDFTVPASMNITEPSGITQAIDVTSPVSRGDVTASFEACSEQKDANGKCALYMPSRGKFILSVADENLKIVKVEFGSDYSKTCDKLIPDTGQLDGPVWTGSAKEVQFAARSAVAITTVKVFMEEGCSRVFADGETYTAAEETLCDSLTYTRRFSNTNWQALYVPFSMDYEEWSEKYDIAEIYNFIEYDDDEDGVFERTCLVVRKLNSGRTEPNYPYLIRAKETGTHSLVMTDKVLEPAEQNSIDCRSVKLEYTFTGTYMPVEDMLANEYYAMSGGKLQQAANAGVVLGAQRWYMSITPRHPTSAAAKAQAFSVWADDERATAIEDLHSGHGLKSAAPTAESPVEFDLMGRNVQGSVKGIRLVNGQKVIGK